MFIVQSGLMGKRDEESRQIMQRTQDTVHSVLPIGCHGDLMWLYLARQVQCLDQQPVPVDDPPGHQQQR
jgi:hypothetical protein